MRSGAPAKAPKGIDVTRAAICELIETGAGIKTFLAVAVVVALHAPVLPATRASIAGTVDVLESPAAVRAGVALDWSPPASQEFESSSDGRPAQSIPFDPERQGNSPFGISLPVQGVDFMFDPEVARSYRTDLATKAVVEEDDASAADNRNQSFADRNPTRSNVNAQEHAKIVAESRFTPHQFLEFNEWDARNFRPPEWVEKVRDVARYEIRTEESRSNPGDTGSWILASLEAFMYIQRQFRAIDPLFLVGLGAIGLPFALIGVAWTVRHRARPARTLHTERPVYSVPDKPRRHRRRRRSSSRSAEGRH